jgi:serine/threonine-protein kinase
VERLGSQDRQASGRLAPELAIGQAVGPYRLEELIGEGATGVVFRALHEADGRTVALKILKSRLSRDETYQRRFAREARAAREVKHRHLVPLLDAGVVDGHHYLAAEYIQGRSLEQLLETDGPLSLQPLLRITMEIATGLEALHRHGLVHRDVKPSNVMLDEEGSASLTDFGLARGAAYSALTRPGQVVGTLDYLAPELIKGTGATAASDVYALGCVVYECLAGAPPFAGKNLFELGLAHLEQAPDDPCAKRADVPRGLSGAVLQALEKEPTRRPATAVTYAQMLRVTARASTGF